MRLDDQSLHKIFAAGIFGLAAIWISLPAHANHPVDINNADVVAAGKAVFEKNCAKCHGKNLGGPETPDYSRLVPPRLDAIKGHASHHSDQYFYDQIANGTRDKSGKLVSDGMPAFEPKLKPSEIWAALSYIKSRWPTAVYRRQHQRNPGHEEAASKHGHGESKKGGHSHN